jgi:hypothetical protein
MLPRHAYSLVVLHCWLHIFLLLTYIFYLPPPFTTIYHHRHHQITRLSGPIFAYPSPSAMRVRSKDGPQMGARLRAVWRRKTSLPGLTTFTALPLLR